MTIGLKALGQIALPVKDVDAAERFYGETLGIRKLFRFGKLAFYDLTGVRLLLEERAEPTSATASILYFRVADISGQRQALEARGVSFIDEIHLVAPMEDHDLWITHFKDPDGNLLTLMMEGPKGYTPAGARRP